MPNDGFTLYAICRELERKLTGARCNKVLQPENDEIDLLLHNEGVNYRLLATCNPVSPRIHLTEHAKENPAAAPAFCMTLRKHLTGTTLSAVRQKDMERAIELDFSGVNELYDPEIKTLIVEIMGKHSNIILVSGSRRILACCKNVSFDVSSVRQVLPGLPYRLAATQDKAAITDAAEVRARLTASSGSAARRLAAAVTGLSYQTAAEICYRALGETEREELTGRDVESIIDMCGRFYNAVTNLDISPCITVSDEGAPRDFFVFPYETIGERTELFPALNEAVDACFYLKDRRQRFADRSRHLAAALKSAVGRAEKKLGNCLATLEKDSDYETDKLYGELITSSLYRLRQGDTSLVADNYYADPPEKIEIPLDARLTPAENAQRCFKRYAKKKRGYRMSLEQAEKLRAHIDYLATVQESFENCTESAELADIRRELAEAGVIARPAPAKKQQKEPESQPLRFTESGYEIYVGKNNYQNDRLTKAARATDVWLHASKIHGSHVVIANPDGGPVPDNVLLRAAELAAYYSKARQSDKAPVDYTLKKYVKKPGGSAPGFVVYTDQTTVYVKPRP